MINLGDPGSYYWQNFAQTRNEENAELLNEYNELNDEYHQLCRRNETLKQENQHLHKRVALDRAIIEDSAHLVDVVNVSSVNLSVGGGLKLLLTFSSN